MRRPRLTFTLLFLSVKIVADKENVRDGRRMILKRCRVTISRVLLVHGPAVCRLTYDRQQLINAFMSIRLAVHHRFKPRPVQLNPPIHPTDQPTTHPATHEGDTLPTPPFSLPLSFLYVYVCHMLFEQLPKIYVTTETPLSVLNDRTITPVDVMY